MGAKMANEKDEHVDKNLDLVQIEERERVLERDFKMLHRAASNAYSWWWASHIRTKQSKWLEQSLQDMEEKVNSMLGIIEDEGDSFAKRAEMYYKRRPELINYVEESYRAYRALAERYEHISKELQSANRTIATVFPDQVPLDLDDDDEEFFKLTPSSKPSLERQVTSKANIPEAPLLRKELRSTTMKPARRGQVAKLNRIPTSAVKLAAPSSGLSKSEAIEEINKLLKEILAIQTEKEFVRSSYERGYQKYWDFENQIAEKQKRVCSLQDEFRVGGVLEDNEARALMATTALKSCQETLAKLRQKQDRSIDEAIIESKRIKEAHEKFAAIRNKFICYEHDIKQPDHSSFELKTLDQEISIMLQEKDDLESLRDMIREELEMEPAAPLTILQLSERIDDLVSRVVNLEISVASQDALVKRLRSEADDLHSQVNSLEEDNEVLKQGSEKTNNKVKQLEEELLRVKKLVKSIAGCNSNLRNHFTEASCNISHLSEKLQNVKMEEEIDSDSESSPATKEHGADAASTGCSETNEKKEDAELRETNEKQEDAPAADSKCEKYKKDLSQTSSVLDTISEEAEDEDEEHSEPNWRQLYLTGLDDREKLLLDEYTAVLRNYKDVKNKLKDVEQRNRDDFYDLATQIRELKRALATRETEIQSLQQRVSGSDKTPEENLDQEVKETAKESPDLKEDDQSKPSSTMEAKIRSDIDELLEENMEFWLRFSTSCHQIQKYQTSVQDLKADLSRLRESQQQEGSSRHQSFHGFDARPIYKHLREIQTELTLWQENNAVLKDEVQGRYSSLCNIQDEITRISNTGIGAKEMELSEYQAAKFQGEVKNMKQENSKVCDELKSGFERVRELKQEVERIMERLEEERGLGARHSGRFGGSRSGRGRIPLRSFLFGVKLKKQRQAKASSMFSCINPVLQKQNSYIAAPAPIEPQSP